MSRLRRAWKRAAIAFFVFNTFFAVLTIQLIDPVPVSLFWGILQCDRQLLTMLVVMAHSLIIARLEFLRGYAEQ